ncbi:MAG: hypothetical protein LBU34_17315 [Planctomycetaceae bacterium]|jgi:hypothetical protein|nr:hypothetical protein [Planctomycetaceae bacterium]
MCITVGGAKRNLRIGIPNPVQKQKVGGVSPKGFHPPPQCRGERFFAPTTYPKVGYRQRNPSAKGCLPLISKLFEENLKIVEIPPCRFLGVGLQWVLLNLQPVLFLP